MGILKHIGDPEWRAYLRTNAQVELVTDAEMWVMATHRR